MGVSFFLGVRGLTSDYFSISIIIVDVSLFKGGEIDVHILLGVLRIALTTTPLEIFMEIKG